MLVDTGTAELINTVAVSHDTVAFWGAISADYTLFADNGADCGAAASCTNNFSGDPKFMDSASGNYHIDIGSAAIDQGTNAGVTDDMDDEPRDALPDLGADEFTLPVAPSLFITASGDDARLTWEHSAYDSAGYEIWWSTNPYFLPRPRYSLRHRRVDERHAKLQTRRVPCPMWRNSYFYLVLSLNKAAGVGPIDRVRESAMASLAHPRS